MTTIDGALCLIDGHARVYAALERGVTETTALYTDLKELGGPTALYQHIHRAGPDSGVRHVTDLASRIVSPAEHKRLWVDYCQAWEREHARARDA